MNFGEAIELVKKGKQLQRAGWNGKNQYIELATNISYKNAKGYFVNVNHRNIGNSAIAFVGTSGVQLGWLASQADMLANDWMIAMDGPYTFQDILDKVNNFEYNDSLASDTFPLFTRKEWEYENIYYQAQKVFSAGDMNTIIIPYGISRKLTPEDTTASDWYLVDPSSVNRDDWPVVNCQSVNHYEKIETKEWHPSRRNLDDYSWKEISMISASGEASNYWSVGDVKYINVNGKIGDKLVLDNERLGVFILGFDHNSKIEGKGISFGTFKTPNGTDVCLSDNGTNYEHLTDGSKIFNMNHWGNYNYGGWRASDIRYDIIGSTNDAPSDYGSARTTSSEGYNASKFCTTDPVPNTLMAALPSDLRAVMKPITKYTDNSGGDTGACDEVSATIDYLPLLSEHEVHGSTTYSNAFEAGYQEQYQYYKDGNSKAKYCHDNTLSERCWWMRSPCCVCTDTFCLVHTDGSAFYDIAYDGLGVACAFLV